jgi:acyl carrier protein
MRRLVPRLREALARTLPEYMMPSAFVLLDAMPLNANGKIHRAALPRPDALDASAVERYAAPRTPTEKRISKMWSDLLGVDRVGIHTNFFTLGGHSLSAMRFLTRLKAESGLHIAIQDFFDAPTVAGLAERLDTLVWTQSGSEGEAPGGVRDVVEI